MMERKRYYENEENTENQYRKTLVQLDDIEKQCNAESNEYLKFIKHAAKVISNITSRNYDENYFENKSFEELLKDNREFYSELSLGDYENCYGNPKYAVKLFGDGCGQAMSYIYGKLVCYLEYLVKGNLFKAVEYNELLISLYEYVKDGSVEYRELKKIVYEDITKNIEKDEEEALREEMSADYSFYTDICRSYDGENFKHLAKYGKPVSQNAIDFAKTMENLPEDTMNDLADVMVDAYLHSFISQGKNRKDRKTVRITYVMGQEKIVKLSIERFEKIGLRPHVYNVASDGANKQFEYDHRFDKGLYVSEEYLNLKEEAYKKACETLKDVLHDQSGLCGIIQFGEKPFTPINITEALKLSNEQLKLIQSNNIKLTQIQDSYIPRGEISFSKSGLPSPEIGENFDEILADFLKINMLDSRKYEDMQQLIIDALDMADYVHVKGRNGNVTDIKINMFKIQNREKETNFLNGGGDVNIPVGEVFTTPVLKGTTGMFHVEEIYLKGFKYEDLKLEFKDGYIASYSCKNFESEEENRKYIEETLLFPHKTLPMGEFAIGSNTLAYVIAKKHKVLDRLPILIVEKMGPHFAIGDPCYVWSEDNLIKNLLDDKAIVAKENEKTANRHCNVSEAYTGIHTDITIPYDSIEFIKSVTKDNEEIYVMNQGRFVLEGVDMLNEPLIEYGY